MRLRCEHASPEEAAVALGELRRVVAQADGEGADRGQLLVDLLGARWRRAFGRAQEALLRVDELLPRLRASDHVDLLATALLDRCYYLEKLGRFEDARGPLNEALPLAEACDLPELKALCHTRFATINAAQHRMPEARLAAERGAAAYDALGDDNGAGLCLILQNYVSLATGALDRGWDELVEAQVRYERAGSRWGMALVLEHFGQIELNRKNPAEALRYYERGLAITVAAGLPTQTASRYHIANANAALGRMEESLEQSAVVLAEYRRQHRVVHIVSTLCIRLSPLIAVGRFAEARAVCDELEEILGSTSHRTTNVPFHTAEAAQHAIDGGRIRLARRLLRMARDHWDLLGQPEQRAKVVAQLDAL